MKPYRAGAVTEETPSELIMFVEVNTDKWEGDGGAINTSYTELLVSHISLRPRY